MELLQYVQQIYSYIPKDGDILVVKLSNEATENEANIIAEFFKDHFDKIGVNNIDVMLIRQGIEIEVIRKEE